MIVFDQSGYTIFNTSTFTISDKPVFIVLTKLLVNNIAISGTRKSGDDDFATNRDITILKELSLDYRHNNFTIEFSSMEMIAPEKTVIVISLRILTRIGSKPISKSIRYLYQS